MSEKDFVPLSEIQFLKHRSTREPSAPLFSGGLEIEANWEEALRDRLEALDQELKELGQI